MSLDKRKGQGQRTRIQKEQYTDYRAIQTKKTPTRSSEAQGSKEGSSSYSLQCDKFVTYSLISDMFAKLRQNESILFNSLYSYKDA